MHTKEKLLEKVDHLLEQKADQRIRDLLSQQDFHAIAYVIDHLKRGRKKTFTLLPPEIQAEVVIVLSRKSKESILPRLSEQTIARFLHFNDEDDATDVLQILPAERRAAILEKMKSEKRMNIEKLLRYGSETAGGIMDFNFIVVKPDFTLKDVAIKVEQHLQTHDHAPTVLVGDEEAKVTGFIPYRKLIVTPRAVVSDLVESMPLIAHTVDREKIVALIAQRRGDIVCVVDDAGHALGVIHLRDLLRVAQAEATEDVYGLAGVDVEEDVLDPVVDKVRRRYNWLIINLATAFLAAFVVSLFQGTIERLAILAVYMPIVAGMGGNAATQALAVTVRGLAVREVPWPAARRVIFREALAGTCNGVITGIIAAGAATAFGSTPMLGVVLGTAMILNLGVAGLFGALVPFILRKVHIDPATASSIFVTTATDVFGFLAFLGLGTLLLT